jgi:hypothetical protein
VFESVAKSISVITCGALEMASDSPVLETRAWVFGFHLSEGLLRVLDVKR